MKASFPRHLAWAFAAVLAVSAFTAPARAAFHLWGLTEVYSDSSGSLQFIEMKDNFGGQTFLAGQQIVSSNVGNTQSNTFTIPGNLAVNSLNHFLLFGTAGIQSAGGPAPDYILPDNFLFAGGGTLTFFGLNSGTHGPLPTNGTLSYTWPGGAQAINSPTNFAGQTGVIPAPASLGVAVGGLMLASRRRRR